MKQFINRSYLTSYNNNFIFNIKYLYTIEAQRTQ